MAEPVKLLINGYRDIMDNKSDPRVKDWPLMSSPLPTLLIVISYVFVVKYLGPNWMRHKKPFKLQKTMVFYNFLQVLISGWLFYEKLIYAWLKSSYSLRCQPVDYSNSPEALWIASVCYWYYISKFTELFDTIFFVLRKKFDHVSVLHVSHHAIMPMSLWLGVKFVAGGHGTFFALLNTFVHIVMYTYYMLAAIGPKVQKYLGWKKYLTVLQLVQFVLALIHSSQLFFIECDYPKLFAYLIAGHAVWFYVLFIIFYKKSYQKQNKGRSKTADADSVKDK